MSVSQPTVLLVHNHYLQPGGESRVYEAEGKLLSEHGHRVLQYSLHNDAIETLGRHRLALKTLWNQETYKEILFILESDRPDIIHVHNTFPLISPSIYHAADRANVPVVQTLHNYRLLCPMAQFFRDGRVCEDCVGRVPWPGVLHGCYKDSRIFSAGVAGMITLHRVMQTWQTKIGAYIVLTEFARRKFLEGGLPSDRLVVKQNFLTSDPGFGEGEGDYVLFVGRLDYTKGIKILLDAWLLCEKLDVSLVIVGDGPMAEMVATAGEQLKTIRWLGWREHEEVIELMRDARLLMFPSIWYEGQPLVILEAFACGLPVIASDLGAMRSIVDADRTGLLFEPGDSEDLARKISRALGDDALRGQLRLASRREYEAKYTADRNYSILRGIYRRVIGKHDRSNVA